jgi:hypothetical protein
MPHLRRLLLVQLLKMIRLLLDTPLLLLLLPMICRQRCVRQGSPQLRFLVLPRAEPISVYAGTEPVACGEMLGGESLLSRVVPLPGGFMLVLLLPLLLAVVIVEDEPVRRGRPLPFALCGPASKYRREADGRGGGALLNAGVVAAGLHDGEAAALRPGLAAVLVHPALLLPSSRCAPYGPSAPPNVRLRGLTAAPPYPSPMLTLKTLLLPEDWSGGWNEKGSSLWCRRRRWGCEFAGCGVGADAPCIRISPLPFLAGGGAAWGE